MPYDVRGNLLLGQIADPVVIVQPTIEPITLAEARKQCEIDDDVTAHDAYLTSLITVGRTLVEKEIGLALIDQTLELRLDGYPRQRVIPLRGPLLGVLSFKYTDADGVLQTLDAGQYVIESAAKNLAPRIVQPYTVTWPYSIPASDSLRIQWRAGFVDRTGSPTESVALIPATLLHAVKLAVSHFFEHRGDSTTELPPALAYLCQPHRVSFGIA